MMEKPQAQDFEDYDDYIEAVAGWQADQKLRQHQVATPTHQPAGEPQVVDEYGAERRETAEAHADAIKRAERAELRGDSFNAKVERDVARSYERDFSNIPEPAAVTEERTEKVEQSEAFIKAVNAGEINIGTESKEQTYATKLIHEINRMTPGLTLYFQKRDRDVYGQDLPISKGSIVAFTFPNEEVRDSFRRVTYDFKNDPIRTLDNMGLDVRELIHKEPSESEEK